MTNYGKYFFFLCLLLVFTGCGDMEKLEQQNAALLSKVDSLEIEHARVAKLKAEQDQKISALQGENKTLEQKLNDPQQKPQTISTQTRHDAGQKPIEYEVVPSGQGARKKDETNASGEFVANYQEALAAFNARQYQRSVLLFQNLLNSSEKNDLRDNCEYWIGEAFYGLKKYQQAVDQFTKLIAMKDSDKRDAALLMRGNCHVLTHEKALAKQDYQKVIEDFPASEYVPKAKEKLAKIR
jgi:TolA-binding protein